MSTLCASEADGVGTVGGLGNTAEEKGLVSERPSEERWENRGVADEDAVRESRHGFGCNPISDTVRGGTVDPGYPAPALPIPSLVGQNVLLGPGLRGPFEGTA